MRNYVNFNEGWRFAKGSALEPQESWEAVALPHCYNAQDGQDGGNDYYRGDACYAKSFRKTDLPRNSRYFLEVRGANSSAKVYLNGKLLTEHHGGYSAFRVDMTDMLQEENLLCILVNNEANETVYPQVADFTFYGGLYRDVAVICVPENHFDLSHYGAPGIKVTPTMAGEDAHVEVETFLTGAGEVRYTIADGEGTILAQTVSGTKASFTIEKARRWHGRRDPYLYTARAELLAEGEPVDEVSARFGCRSFEIHPEKGFILNGESYPLRGVSRHQDRWGIGNALLPEHHKEDMDLICEVGATTIRLAHYQHDQYFYDLCDERGMVVWAEIPYISRHMPAGRENTVRQMKELICQNYNHPSIVVWGLSNEITIAGGGEDLLENHKLLNDLCHEMDPTRRTTIAAVSMCKIDDPYLQIPDVVSYNHYFGWYGGETDMNGPWFDKFHAAHPDIPIGCSEYGCEALNWHSSNPIQGDYTEEYQAYYHEELIRQLFSRPYLWATHVWNMFDFGADGRSEGGENGQNHKGLMTFDRKYRKDAFYAYKAWLNPEPMVHICGKRYVDRVEEVTKVTVYSNAPSVELFANGVSLGVKEAEDHFFYFEVPNKGETTLVAKAGDCTDESRIRKVDTFNEAYRLKEQGTILNWFDITEREGCLSLNSKTSEVLATLRGKALLLLFLLKVIPKKGKGRKEKGKKGLSFAGFQITDDMMQMVGGFTLIRLVTMAGGMLNMKIEKETLLKLNKRLNGIKKKKA